MLLLLLLLLRFDRSRDSQPVTRHPRLPMWRNGAVPGSKPHRLHWIAATDSYIYHIYRTYTYVVAIICNQPMRIGPHLPSSEEDERKREKSGDSSMTPTHAVVALCCALPPSTFLLSSIVSTLLLDGRQTTNPFTITFLGGRTARNRIKVLELSRGERRSTAGDPSNSANRANAAR